MHPQTAVFFLYTCTNFVCAMTIVWKMLKSANNQHRSAHPQFFSDTDQTVVHARLPSDSHPVLITLRLLCFSRRQRQRQQRDRSHTCRSARPDAWNGGTRHARHGRHGHDDTRPSAHAAHDAAAIPVIPRADNGQSQQRQHQRRNIISIISAPTATTHSPSASIPTAAATLPTQPPHQHPSAQRAANPPPQFAATMAGTHCNCNAAAGLYSATAAATTTASVATAVGRSE